VGEVEHQYRPTPISVGVRVCSEHSIPHTGSCGCRRVAFDCQGNEESNSTRGWYSRNNGRLALVA
jgi:hypothetical protein